MKSLCCNSECDIASKQIVKSTLGLQDIEDVGWRCLQCGHKFHVWNKVADVKDEKESS